MSTLFQEKLQADKELESEKKEKEELIESYETKVQEQAYMIEKQQIELKKLKLQLKESNDNLENLKFVFFSFFILLYIAHLISISISRLQCQEANATESEREKLQEQYEQTIQELKNKLDQQEFEHKLNGNSIEFSNPMRLSGSKFSSDDGMNLILQHRIQSRDSLLISCLEHLQAVLYPDKVLFYFHSFPL